ncbi:MAG: helix-turn-helix transcriptional regulator [Planctomycetota bacterium]
MTDSQASLIGQRVRQRREALRLTQIELGARTGMSQPYISEIERGIIGDKLTLRTIQRLAEALGCTAGGLAD